MNIDFDPTFDPTLPADNQHIDDDDIELKEPLESEERQDEPN